MHCDECNIDYCTVCWPLGTRLEAGVLKLQEAKEQEREHDEATASGFSGFFKSMLDSKARDDAAREKHDREREAIANAHNAARARRIEAKKNAKHRSWQARIAQVEQMVNDYQAWLQQAYLRDREGNPDELLAHLDLDSDNLDPPPDDAGPPPYLETPTLKLAQVQLKHWQESRPKGKMFDHLLTHPDERSLVVHWPEDLTPIDDGLWNPDGAWTGSTWDRGNVSGR